MLLHLDSYDLINVFRGSPIGSEEFRRRLVERDTNLVCSPETIQEVVKPNDFEESRRRLEALTTFPRCYIHEKKELFRREFSCALATFQSNAAYKGEDVGAFVGTWQEVDPPLDKKFGVAKDWLVDIIMPLLKAEPDRFRNTAASLRTLMANVVYDRANRLNLRVGSLEIFRHSVGAALMSLGLHPPRPCEEFITDFAEWLHEKPSICPAWRLMAETYSEFAHNSNDQGQRGDPPDFAHVSVTAYVDAITLDSRVSNYVRIATRRLAQIDSEIDYDKRMFRNFGEWLASRTRNEMD
jgi:hypothetical protein